LDSSAVGIVQLAHEAGEFILCHDGSDAVFPNDFGRTCWCIALIYCYPSNSDRYWCLMASNDDVGFIIFSYCL